MHITNQHQENAQPVFVQLHQVTDFVAETDDAIYMIEVKAASELEAPEVLLKKEAATRWCSQASAHAATYAGKPWQYALIPHDAIAQNMALAGLAERT